MSPHYTDSMMDIFKIKCGPYDNNAYVVSCKNTNESLIIDAPLDPGELVAIASTTNVKFILITHGHMDHVLGFEEVISEFNVPVGIGSPDADAISENEYFPLIDCNQITIGQIDVDVIGTPGHTDGSTCFKVGKHVFTGDTLFPGGPGKTGSPSDLSVILSSITSKLFTLSPDSVFHPGHGDDGLLGEAIREYDIFIGRDHPEDLCGDVLWMSS